MALAADSKSSKVRLRGAEVWERIALVSGSILRIAPQSGQVTSNGLVGFAFIAGDYFRTISRAAQFCVSEPDSLVPGTLLARLLNQQFGQRFSVAAEKPHSTQKPLLQVTVGKEVERNQVRIA